LEEIFGPFDLLDEKEVGVASMSNEARAQHRVCKSLAGKDGTGSPDSAKAEPVSSFF